MHPDQLSKTKFTGVEQVDTLQDGVNNLVGGQVGKGGLLQPAGDLVSKEGVNRAERKGKDDSGNYGPGGVGNSVVGGAQGVGNTVSQGASGAAGKVTEGVKGAGGYLGGVWGGKKEEEK